MRAATPFLLAIPVLAAAFGASWAEVVLQPPGPRPEAAALVRQLGLSDLCLATEARYTRHPSLADRHAAFQQHPMALDHFPSGSVVGPPPHLRVP